MIILTAIICLALLALMHWAISHEMPATGGIVVGLMGLLMPPMFLLFVSTPVATFSILLIVLGVCFGITKAKPPTCRKWISFALICGIAAGSIRAGIETVEMGALQEKYPYESMARRVPVPDLMATTPLTKESAWRLSGLEESLSERDSFWLRKRHRALEVIHATTVERFVRAQGFGVGRMTHLGEWAITSLDAPPVIPLQARSALRELPSAQTRTTLWQSSNAERSDPAAPETDKNKRHELQTSVLSWQEHVYAVVDFANTEGSGHVVSREKVAGFQSHGFRNFPTYGEKLEIIRADTLRLVQLQLVSLLKNTEARVYDSDNLPRMEDLASSSNGTRPLTIHERSFLRRIRQGKDLVFHTMGQRVLAMGALRAADQCCVCHGVDRGTLLGCFSYEWEISGDTARSSAEFTQR